MKKRVLSEKDRLVLEGVHVRTSNEDNNIYYEEYLRKESGSYPGSPYNLSERDVQANIAVISKDMGVSASLGKRLPFSGAFSDIYDIVWNGEEAILKVARDKTSILGEKFVKNQRLEIHYLHLLSKDSGDTYVAKMLQAVEFRDLYDKPSSYFIIMKKYESFNSYVEEYPITEKRLCLIADGLLTDLRYLHSYQIIHQDLKPSNIVVRYDADRQPHFLLIDFNVSRIVGPLDTSVTIAGTTDYMDPLLSQKGKVKCSEISDLYSLGSILFGLISGNDHLPRKLWDSLEGYTEDTFYRDTLYRDTIYRDTLQSVLFAHANKTGFSTEFCNMILRTVDPDLQKRYSSAEEMRSDIHEKLGYRGYKKMPALKNASFYVNLDEDGDPLWAAENPLGKIAKFDQINIVKSMVSIEQKMPGFLKAYRSNNYIVKPASFFEKQIHDTMLSKLKDNSVYKEHLSNMNTTLIERYDIVSFDSGEACFVIDTLIVYGFEYYFVIDKPTSKAFENHKKIKKEEVGGAKIYKLTDDGDFYPITAKSDLCKLILLFWDNMKERPLKKNYQELQDMVTACYYSGSPDDVTEENKVRILTDGLDSHNQEARSIASYLLGGRYLLGKGVKKDNKKAQILLSSSDKDYALKWKERAFGFTPAHCVLWMAMVLGEILLELVLFRYDPSAFNLNPAVITPSTVFPLYLLLLFCYYVHLLVHYSIWKFNMPEYIQLLPLLIAVPIFARLIIVPLLQFDYISYFTLPL